MSIIVTHPMNGTIGAQVVATNEGFARSDGALPVYVAGGVSGGVSARFDGANGVSNLNEDRTAEYSQLYVRFPSAPTGNLLFYRVIYGTSGASAALMGIHGTQNLYITSGFSEVAATTTTLTVGTWYRIDWHVGASSQELRLYTSGGTLLETLTGTSNGGPTSQYNLGPVSQFNGVIDIDQVSILDAWPTTTTTTSPGTYIYTGGAFALHTPYVYNGSSWSEYDLQP